MSPLAQEAYNALMAKEYDKALELYTALEQQKEPTSYYYLGFLYFHGHAVIQDSKKAFDYYLMSATREVPVAQFEVALMLENVRDANPMRVRQHSGMKRQPNEEI